MSNTRSFAWVKNVYSLRISGGISSGHSYTALAYSPTFTRLAVEKLSKLSRFVPAFASHLSPAFSDRFHLLYRQLYPLSTPLIITETKIN